jgi:signal transduction histidine kinase
VTVAAVAIAAAIVGRVQFDTDPSLYIFYGYWLVAELIPGVIAFAIAGVFLLGYPKAAVVGWVMLACSIFWGVSVLSAGLFVTSFEQGWNTTVEFQTASLALGGLGFATATVVLPQVYPDGLLAGWFWRTLFAVSLVVGVGFEAFNAAFSWGTWQEDNPLAFVDFDVVNRSGWASWYVCMAIVAVVLVERLRRGPALVRRQVGLFAVVWVIMMVASLLMRSQLGAESDLVGYLDASWPAVAVAVVAVTVVRYRLYDIRLVIRRAVVYGTMVLVLTALFAGVYFLVLWGLSSRVGQGYRWVAVMAAVVVVLAADPLRRRMRVALERRLLGTRGEPLRSLARLDTLVSAGSADEPTVYRMITQTVAEAVRAPGVVLAMHRGVEMDSVALSGAVSADPVVVPLVHRGERLGELRVGSRTPGERYGRTDRALLDQLANQAAAVVYGLRRDRDIDAVRREAIEAMAEQRMTLGRDLHDGLAPLLAGSALTADSLRRGMPEGSPDAEEAGRLTTRLRNAATEVRHIAHHLQPTGAGAAGLAGLIEDYVSSLTGPSVPSFTLHLDDFADHRLPATVELAMSRVALEAINNVVRHAHAAHAEVSLRLVDGTVELMVSDDGVGIGQPYVSGLGITSMRSRIEAMGGSFDMSPAAGGGSRLTARVPVPS